MQPGRVLRHLHETNAVTRVQQELLPRRYRLQDAAFPFLPEVFLAVEALGKIGEAAAEVAVPSLVRALRDQDNWVSALAAEALGEMGESADEAIPALVRALGHGNPRV